jgi:hypothetical protein
MISMGKRILDNFTVEVWLRDKRTFKTAPITRDGQSPNPYAIFKDNYIKALEKVVTEEFLRGVGEQVIKKITKKSDFKGGEIDDSK